MQDVILPACAITAIAGLLIAIGDATQANSVCLPVMRSCWICMLILRSKLDFAAMLLLILGTAIARLEMFVAYFRVLKVSKPAQIVIFLAGVLVAASSIIAWFLLLFACKPIDASWDLRHSKVARCINRYLLHLVQAMPGIVADFTVMAVMLIKCLPHQSSWKEKAALLVQCSSAILLLAPAVARIFVLATAGEGLDTASLSGPVMLCFVIEANLVIIYISVPRVRQGVHQQGSQDTTSMMNSGGMFREIDSRLGGDDGSTNTINSVRHKSDVELLDRPVV